MTENNDTGPNAPAQRTTHQPAQKAQKDQRYLEARRLLEAGAVTDRRALAENTKTRPEVLYYLAEDADRQVRKKVATNDNTPHQADMILTSDPDEEVRVELARKIARLVPGLPDLEQEKLRTRICTVIERLAQDSLPKCALFWLKRSRIPQPFPNPWCCNWPAMWKKPSPARSLNIRRS
ncbi:hypothetical protein JCM17845_28080 [Iodidimonas gelatinilytica]|uniref:Uncharacterized protein n=1 Tax=Iodidimonas gelatinilytica TaxID=1236966 RepID=A0A5A7N3C4_9PROT|nr:hypothetical protein [Iodidimonas gelatinilytica]GER02185.1 hypothetical protein JCM17845_28080 [Iodidimonas gelatinilytica]